MLNPILAPDLVGLIMSSPNIEPSCAWETPSSSLAPHEYREYRYPSSLAPFPHWIVHVRFIPNNQC